MDAATSPQPLAVGEAIQNSQETAQNTKQKQSYAELMQQSKSVAASLKLELIPVHMIHGEPTIEFKVDEVNNFTIEEGLHQAVILKFSYSKPEIQQLRQIIPKQFDVKGKCNVGQLEYRHILVRFDLFEDYVQVLSRTTGYVKEKGDEFFFRTFPWTMGFNPREETSKAVVWISLPDLPANCFAKKSLLSIAAAVGKPLAVDKATQDRTRPSTARVKVLIDLMNKHPKRVKISIVDIKSGKNVEYYQQIVIDNLPKYCTCCKHQGHEVKTCRWRTEEKNKVAVQVEASEGQSNLDKLAGNARDLLTAKRAEHFVEGLEKSPGQSGAKGAECGNVLDGNRAGIEPASSGEAGQFSVPVSTAIARVMQDLMTAKNSRGSGESTDVAMEPVQLQLLMDDSILTSAARAIISKHKAAVADLGVMEKSGKQQVPIGSQLEANNALRTGRKHKAGSVKTSVVQEGQEEEQNLEDVDALCSAAVIGGDTNATSTGSKGINGEVYSVAKGDGKLLQSQSATTSHKSYTKNKKWSVVNKPTIRKQSEDVQNQFDPSNVIGVSNSFEALIDDREQEDNNKEQYKGDQQKNAKETDAQQVQNSEEVQILDSADDTGFKASAGQSNTPLAGVMPTTPFVGISNSIEAFVKQIDDKKGADAGDTRKIHAADTPTLHISKLELDKMVTDALAAMTKNTGPAASAGQTVTSASDHNGYISTVHVADTPTLHISNLQLLSAEQQRSKEDFQPVYTLGEKLAPSETDAKGEEGGKQYTEVSASGRENQHTASENTTNAGICTEAKEGNHAAISPATDSNNEKTKSNISTSKKHSAAGKQIGPPNVIAVENSFDTLVNEGVDYQITEAHNSNSMMMNVTTNTSVLETSSQSVESCAAGQLPMSTGNKDELTQAKVIKSKLWLQQHEEDDEDAKAWETATNSLLWIQQREYDDEEDLGIDFVDDSSDDGDIYSGDEEMASVVSTIPKISSFAKVGPVGKLNATAPVFIPSSRQQSTGPSITSLNTPTNSPTGDCNSVAFSQDGQHQLVTTSPVISLEERQPLDAMATLVTVQADKTLKTQADLQDMPNPILVGRDIYEEGEEDDILGQCRGELLQEKVTCHQCIVEEVRILAQGIDVGTAG